jgi:hypothetical protein
VALCVALFAATPRADYQRRVNEAAQLAQGAVEKLDTQTEATLAKLAQLLPAAEDVVEPVAGGEQLIRINNSPLQEQLAQLPLVTTDDEEDQEDAELRVAQWQELSDYLNALNARVNDLNTPLPTNFKLERNQLDNILARAEYKTDEREASGIQHWLKQQWQRFAKWLRTLFRQSEREPTKPGQGTVKVARVIIVTILIAALAFALYQLSQWWRARQPKDKKEKAREILGVEITDETTTEDLLAAARALAQQGDYRGAIRRAYIALLYELEQRGKLRLHRSKTNRDYLNALRHETALYSSFAALTRSFEIAWYGQSHSTQFDFEGFLSGYSDLVKTEK